MDLDLEEQAAMRADEEAIIDEDRDTAQYLPHGNDLAAMRADWLDTIAESVARCGTDLSRNQKLGFMLRRAKAMGVEDSALEAVIERSRVPRAGAKPEPPQGDQGACPREMAHEAAACAPRRYGTHPLTEAIIDEAFYRLLHLNDNDLGAMRADVLDAIAESVARCGTDFSTNLKLGFMLKRAKAMGVADSALEAVIGDRAAAASSPGGGRNPAPAEPRWLAAIPCAELERLTRLPAARLAAVFAAKIRKILKARRSGQARPRPMAEDGSPSAWGASLQEEEEEEEEEEERGFQIRPPV